MMKTIMCLSRVCIVASLLCLLFPQVSFSQDVCGKWKCPKEMFQEWGYRSVKGHITFKKDNTFKLIA